MDDEAADITNSRSNSKLGSSGKRTSCSAVTERCKACSETDSKELHMSEKVRRADSQGFRISTGTFRTWPKLAQIWRRLHL